MANLITRYIGWGYAPGTDASSDVVNCGLHLTVQLAEEAVDRAGLTLAEVETVTYREGD
jgi:hypothetical protein